MKKIYQQKNKGFTLVETLVAISIFTMSILALLVVLTQGIANTNYAKTKIIASYLAQEGIEYIRNMRDTFVLYDATDSQTGWNSFNSKLINSSCQIGNGCYFDDQNLNYANPVQPMAGITVSPCGASCPPLLYDEITGKYGYTTGVNSGFTRKVKITVISPNEIKVFSTLYWTQSSGSYNIVFSESLFNWIE
ncbi:MAG: hypothetical protein G01um101424_326 [Parcubacteria group bacterium Gr01-1014_24]|nr:MAG: hypothetical protein G01um101424_326 [Parcubacteria group bacterium Gr01-1014_24]